MSGTNHSALASGSAISKSPFRVNASNGMPPKRESASPPSRCPLNLAAACLPSLTWAPLSRLRKREGRRIWWRLSFHSAYHQPRRKLRTVLALLFAPAKAGRASKCREVAV